jgi:hypothetical protein
VLQFGNTQWPEASVAWCRSEGCDSPLEHNTGTDTDDSSDSDSDDETDNEA